MTIIQKILLAITLLLLLPTIPSVADDNSSRVSGVNSQRAILNYILNCQGCHQRGGQGSEGGAPTMVGVVANFLNAPGGREFLLRVPGVATTALKSDAVAEVMNWLVYEFDEEHVPADFKPFTAEEVERQRQHPYVQEAEHIRKDLINYLNTK